MLTPIIVAVRMKPYSLDGPRRVLMNSQQESEQSRKVRRGFGYLAIGALCVAAVGFIIGLVPVGVTGFLVFLLLPYAVMVVHLNATRALTLTEKKLWARELWLSHRSIVAVWAYLFAADLGERARGFARS